MSEHNKLKAKADEYLRDKRVVQLFEDLATALCFHRPSDVNAFLVEQLKLRKSQGFKTGLFSQEQVQNTFNLFDLTKKKVIAAQQCREALRILASSQLQDSAIEEADIPGEVDSQQFEQIVYKVLGC